MGCLDTEPKPGIYRHFKGGVYELIDVATHSETGERLVVYRALYGMYDLWVRPLAMWSEEVNHGGVLQPRFTYLHAAPHGNSATEQYPTPE
ncbi:MAG: DUF1653 domain-containing protein [Clostridia bacterium]